MKRLESLALENSEIVLAQAVEGGTFTTPQGVSFEGLAPFLRVVVHSRAAEGSFIQHEVWLPYEWNGIFVGTGNGGIAGEINYRALVEHIKEGYAVANTDMGTSLGRESGISNEQVWMDFGWRATHIMTEVGKAIVRAYYGRREAYAYFVGASTGGQQAFSEAQRYPEEYDGIVAGVPANNRLYLHTYFLWNWRHLRTRDGRGLFSKEEIEQIYAAAVRFLREKGDGEAADGFVSFPYADAHTVNDFMAFLPLVCPTLTQAQLSALRAVYSGPKNPRTGEQIYGGMPLGSEVYGCGIWDCQAEESPHFYPFIWAFGADYDGQTFDFDRDLDRAGELLSGHLNANCADLSAFAACGGKMIAFSGGSDPCVPFHDAMEYYNRVTAQMGGYEKTAAFFRFFVYPGREHGNGGRGVNTIWNDAQERGTLLDCLRRWCEKGIAPDKTVGARIEAPDGNARVVFVREVYPYKADKIKEKDFPAVCALRYLQK